MCMIEMADEVYRVWTKVERQARKEYRCCECGRDIAVGERYQRVTGLHSLGWDTWHTCLHCAWAAGWLMSECNGYLHGAVYEDLKEHWDEELLLRNMDLGRRIVGMRRRWLWRDGRPMTLEYLTT